MITQSVADGTWAIPPAIAVMLREHLRERRNGAPTCCNEYSRNRRERQIVDLIVKGLTNKEIAEQLNIATDNVKNHKYERSYECLLEE